LSSRSYQWKRQEIFPNLERIGEHVLRLVDDERVFFEPVLDLQQGAAVSHYSREYVYVVSVSLVVVAVVIVVVVVVVVALALVAVAVAVVVVWLTDHYTTSCRTGNDCKHMDNIARKDRP
jgi:hypothetical protein